MGVQVLPEINQILTAVVTTVTFKGPVFTVSKAHVIPEGRRQWAGHVTQRALVVIHMVPHVITQEPLCGKSLGTVRALETLLWGGVGRTKGTEEDSEGQGRGDHPKHKGATHGAKGSYRWDLESRPELKPQLYHLLAV